MTPSTVIQVKVRPVSAPEGAAGGRIWIQMEKQQGDLVTASKKKNKGKLQTHSNGSMCHKYVQNWLKEAWMCPNLLS